MNEEKKRIVYMSDHSEFTISEKQFNDIIDCLRNNKTIYFMLFGDILINLHQIVCIK